MSEPSTDKTQISEDNKTKAIPKEDVPAQENEVNEQELTTGDVQRIKFDALTGLPKGSEPVAKPFEPDRRVVWKGQVAEEIRAALKKSQEDQEEKK